MECEMLEAITTVYEKSTDDDEKSEKSTITIDEEKSEKSTDEEKSEKSTDDDKSESAVLGMKRKIEDEEEEESESEDYESEVEESDDEEAEENWFEDEPEEEILINGEHFTKERLLRCMYYSEGEKYAYRRTNKFLNKARRYLKSVCDSGGFDISDWPGHVGGLTTVVPKNYILDERDIYPEGFYFIKCLADMAIEAYNKDNNDSNYEVKSIKTVNASFGQGPTYYITFTAAGLEDSDEQTFQANVWDNIPGGEINVTYCNLKPA